MTLTDTTPTGDSAPSEMDGTAEVGDTPVEGTEPVGAAADLETQAEQLDLSQFDNHVVKITVDGKDEYVPVKELPNMAMRHADYTRKTQEIAEMRKRLQPAEALAVALERDPEGTLKALNEAYGLDVGNDNSAAWDDLDPQEQRLMRLEQELQAQRARDARNAIDSEFKSLEQAYGEFDRSEVANFALKNNLTVSDAYRVMHFDNLRAEHERLAKEQQVLAQKRSGTLPSASGGAQKAAVGPASKGKMMSLRDSYLAALKQVS